MASRKEGMAERDSSSSTAAGSSSEPTSSSTTPTPAAISPEDITKRKINRTFDEAKANTRRAIDEAERELPRYMQTVTSNQEQSVRAAREIIENYLESQREITNSVQSYWKSFIDGVFWLPARRSTEAYAGVVSTYADATIAAIRIWNNIVYANTEAVKLSLQYTRDNSSELSRVYVNAVKQLENAAATSSSITTSLSSFEEVKK